MNVLFFYHSLNFQMVMTCSDCVLIFPGLVVFILQGDCEWVRHRRQGVYFFRSPWESSGEGRAEVTYSFTFEPTSGDIKMDFSVASL